VNWQIIVLHGGQGSICGISEGLAMKVLIMCRHQAQNGTGTWQNNKHWETANLRQGSWSHKILTIARTPQW